MQILVVEDEPKRSIPLSRGLTDGGHRVAVCTGVDNALAQLRNGDFDIVLIDWSRCDASGLELVRSFASTSPTPVICLSGGEVDVASRVAALRAGADEVLNKPVAMEELVARLEALQRRISIASGHKILAGATLDARRHALVKGEVETRLTAREFSLLAHLADHVGAAVSRADLLAKVWGQGFVGEGNVVDVYVGYVRHKLRQAVGDAARIDAVRGVGYRLIIS